MLDQILENDESQSLPARIDGLQVGTITGFDGAGFPLVSVPGLIETPIVAAAICDIATLEIGAQCGLMFQSGSPSSPVIMGMFTQPLVTLGNSSNVQIHQDENRYHQDDLSHLLTSLLIAGLHKGFPIHHRMKQSIFLCLLQKNHVLKES